MNANYYTLLAVVTFLFSIPLSVWLLANILGLLDQRPITKPLTRLIITNIGIALFLVLTHRSLWLPMALAFTLVALCHAAAGFFFRFFALGIPVVKKGPGDRKEGGESSSHRDA